MSFESFLAKATYRAHLAFVCLLAMASSQLSGRLPSNSRDAHWNADRKDNQTSSRGPNREDSIGDLASLAVPSRRDGHMGSFRPKEAILSAVSSVKDTVKTLDDFLGRSMSSKLHGMTVDDDDSMTHELRRLAKNEAALRDDLDGLYVDLNEDMAGESCDLSEKEAVLRNELEKASLENAFSYDAEENMTGMLHSINHVRRDKGDSDETAPGLCRVSPASLFSSDVGSRERDSYSTFATGPVDPPPTTSKTVGTVPQTAAKRPSQVLIKMRSERTNSFYGLSRQVSENNFRSLQDTLDRVFSGDIEEGEEEGTALADKIELMSENQSLQRDKATVESDVRDEALPMDSVTPLPGEGTAGSCAGTNTSETERAHDFTVMNPDLTKMDTQVQVPHDRGLIFGLASLVFGQHEYQTYSLFSLHHIKSETHLQKKHYARTYEGGLCVCIAAAIAVKNVHNSNALLPHVSGLVMTVLPPVVTWIQSKLPHRMDETTLGLFIIVGQALVCHVFLPAFESKTAHRGSEVMDSPC